MKVRPRQLALALLGILPALSQTSAKPAPEDAVQLRDAGQIVVDGKSASYVIHRLPVSSFPDLPANVASSLNGRGCTIPQTYEAHRPENVVHASLERPGSSDWAVLCSVKGTVSLLVFFDGVTGQEAAVEPLVLASIPEVQRLQAHDPSGVLGFNWGIDPATPRQVHDAQVGLAHAPARVDHDALADSIVDRRTVYHFYTKLSWTLLEMPD
jgi:hypothetical protein